MMNLFLARHGQAASPHPGSPASITPQGKSDIMLMGRELIRQKIKIQQIWYSPKTRTKETAHLYASILGLKDSHLIENQNLSIHGDASLVFRQILESSLESLMIVSHQPLLEELSSCLIPGSDSWPQLFFPTAGIVAFGKGPQWEWLWLWDPKTLEP